MSFIANFDQSNTADWTFDISATDADTGDAIDFTGASVSFVVKDENNCQKLTASIDSGITQPDANTLEVAFTASQMEALCAGSYKIGCVYSLNGSINQLLSGTVSIYDGVAKL
jgi:hypothetical protein